MVVAFSSLARIWENVRPVIPCLCFTKLFVFVFIKVEISLCKLIPLFRPGSVHSGSASRGDCGRMFPDKLRVSSFPDRFPHYSWTPAWPAHSDFGGSRVYACLGVTCHLHLWQNDRGLLRATAVTRELPNKSQHTKSTQEKIFFFPAAPARFRTRSLPITSPAL